MWLQSEAFEREKLARVAAEAERRAAADEARLAVVAARQAAAEQVQQALAETAEREACIRCAHARGLHATCLRPLCPWRVFMQITYTLSETPSSLQALSHLSQIMLHVHGTN